MPLQIHSISIDVGSISSTSPVGITNSFFLSTAAMVVLESLEPRAFAAFSPFFLQHFAPFSGEGSQIDDGNGAGSARYGEHL